MYNEAAPQCYLLLLAYGYPDIVVQMCSTEFLNIGRQCCTEQSSPDARIITGRIYLSHLARQGVTMVRQGVTMVRQGVTMVRQGVTMVRQGVTMVRQG